ncbi:YaiI/YqxD family protein [Agaribacter flavus]|uniref:UPF0178 protein ACFOHL_08675 n=1 Tax=Agaribacter flavus TaxID=1902781 RepID=A0ABV7FN04_9ALTE
MHIYVDADGCPTVVKDIICRAAERRKITTLFIANHYIKLPPSSHVKSVQVSAGFDVADNEIVKRCESNDIVITSDIPLASEIIEKQAQVITFRGETLDKQNIRARLNTRDFMETMRASGIQTSGPAPFGQRDKKAFADTLDRLLAQS